MAFTTNKFISRRFAALGTINEIAVSGADEAVLERAVKRVEEIEKRMSAYRNGSDIEKLSRDAGVAAIAIDGETMALLKSAAAFSALSDGAFDITVGPLIKLWGINKKHDYVPARRDIRRAKRLVNYRDIESDDGLDWAYLKRKGQSADLGGIAKGYAADEVKRIFLRDGAKSAVINLGGNIALVGANPDGEPFRIGIQNPSAERGRFVGKLLVKNKAIVTSGVNERFFIKDGVRYHHIIDLRTGYPAQSGLLSVTAVCDSALTADAVTTAAFVLGLSGGAALFEKCGVQGVFITEKHEVFATDGLKDSFSMP